MPSPNTTPNIKQVCVVLCCVVLCCVVLCCVVLCCVVLCCVVLCCVVCCVVCDCFEFYLLINKLTSTQQHQHNNINTTNTWTSTHQHINTTQHQQFYCDVDVVDVVGVVGIDCDVGVGVVVCVVFVFVALLMLVDVAGCLPCSLLIPTHHHRKQFNHQSKSRLTTNHHIHIRIHHVTLNQCGILLIWWSHHHQLSTKMNQWWISILHWWYSIILPNARLKGGEESWWNHCVEHLQVAIDDPHTANHLLMKTHVLQWHHQHQLWLKGEEWLLMVVDVEEWATTCFFSSWLTFFNKQGNMNDCSFNL